MPSAAVRRSAPALLAALMLAALAQPAAAQKVHRCVDAKGNVTFSDKRCGPNDAARSPITQPASPLAEPADRAEPAARLAKLAATPADRRGE